MSATFVAAANLRAHDVHGMLPTSLPLDMLDAVLWHDDGSRRLTPKELSDQRVAELTIISHDPPEIAFKAYPMWERIDDVLQEMELDPTRHLVLRTHLKESDLSALQHCRLRGGRAALLDALSRLGMSRPAERELFATTWAMGASHGLVALTDASVTTAGIKARDARA